MSRRLICSDDIPRERDLLESQFQWIHFPYDYRDYSHNGAHSFRIWFNTDKEGRYPIGKKYRLGKETNIWIDGPRSTRNEPQPLEYYTTLRQAFKAGVKWCQQDLVFLIKDRDNRSRSHAQVVEHEKEMESL